LTAAVADQIVLPRMRTFLETHLFGTGDRVLSWVGMAGIAWLAVGISSALLAIGLIATFWYLGYGIMVAVFGACLPLWFARRLLLHPSSTVAACATVYGAALAAGIQIFAPRALGSTIVVLAAMILPTLSAVAAWEIARQPTHGRVDICDDSRLRAGRPVVRLRPTVVLSGRRYSRAVDTDRAAGAIGQFEDIDRRPGNDAPHRPAHLREVVLIQKGAYHLRVSRVADAEPI
jgi:hypothetical protein